MRALKSWVKVAVKFKGGGQEMVTTMLMLIILKIKGGGQESDVDANHFNNCEHVVFSSESV